MCRYQNMNVYMLIFSCLQKLQRQRAGWRILTSNQFLSLLTESTYKNMQILNVRTKLMSKSEDAETVLKQWDRWVSAHSLFAFVLNDDKLLFYWQSSCWRCADFEHFEQNFVNFCTTVYLTCTISNQRCSQINHELTLYDCLNTGTAKLGLKHICSSTESNMHT